MNNALLLLNRIHTVITIGLKAIYLRSCLNKKKRYSPIHQKKNSGWRASNVILKYSLDIASAFSWIYKFGFQEKRLEMKCDD